MLQRPRPCKPLSCLVTHVSGHQVTSVIVKCWGGGGGGGSSNHSSYGGAGGFVQAEFSVIEGETLEIVVGGGGQGCALGSDRGGLRRKKWWWTRWFG